MQNNNELGVTVEKGQTDGMLAILGRMGIEPNGTEEDGEKAADVVLKEMGVASYLNERNDEENKDDVSAIDLSRNDTRSDIQI